MPSLPTLHMAFAEQTSPESPKSRENPEIFIAHFAKYKNVFRMAELRKKDREVAGVFKALGHPARVRMLRLLKDGERCVCDLVDVSGLGWSAVSRHLSVMKAAGVLTDEKRGKQVIYRLELPCVGRFLACLDQPGKYPEMHAVCVCEGS